MSKVRQVVGPGIFKKGLSHTLPVPGATTDYLSIDSFYNPTNSHIKKVNYI